MFGNTFQILCSLPWIQGLVPEDGKFPLPPKSFSTPTRARGFTGPCVLTGIVQLLSHVWHFVITCTAAKHASFHYFAEFPQTHVHWVSDVISSSHSFDTCPCDNNLSQHQGLFQWAGSSHHWPKCWSFIFIISPSIEYCSTTSKTKLMFLIT